MLFSERGNRRRARLQRIAYMGIHRLKMNSQPPEGRVQFRRRHRKEKSMRDMDTCLADQGELLLLLVVLQPENQRFHPRDQVLAVVVLKSSQDPVTLPGLEQRKIH